MQKLIELVKDNTILVSSKIEKFIRTDYIYLPMISNPKLLVNFNDNVKIGTPLFTTPTGLVTSPISGKVIEISSMETLNGEEKCLKIANDFEEKTTIDPKIKTNIKNINQKILDKVLKLYFNITIDNPKNLVLNALDDEPYIVNENFYLFYYYESFLELLDCLAKIYNFQTITICVKASSSENINKLMECLGMYPNIKLNILPNLYLLGNNNILMEYLEIKKDETFILKASILYHIYNLVLRNRTISDRLITISGNAINNPLVIKTKIGARIEDILNNLIEFKTKDYLYVLDGLMTGKVIANISNLIVTEDTKGLLLMNKKAIKKEDKCLQCGACLNICPVNINPKLLSNNTYFKSIKDKCLKCGLCSYICPVYIDFNKYLRRNIND